MKTFLVLAQWRYMLVTLPYFPQVPKLRLFASSGPCSSVTASCGAHPHQTPLPSPSFLVFLGLTHQNVPARKVRGCCSSLLCPST